MIVETAVKKKNQTFVCCLESSFEKKKFLGEFDPNFKGVEREKNGGRKFYLMKWWSQWNNENEQVNEKNE